MARPTRKLTPVKSTMPAKVASFQPPAPGGTENARVQMALDALGPASSSISPSLAAAQCVAVELERYTTKEQRAASHAMDFNGTSLSALSFVAGTGFPGFPTLALLTQLPEYRAMHEVFADEVIRTWGKPVASGDCDPAMLSQICDEVERLSVRDVVRELVVHDQAFGRAHAAIRIRGDAQVRSTPLVARPYTVRKGAFDGIKAVEPYWVTPNMYNSIDPWRDDFYKPSSWWVLGQEIHATRLRTLISRPVPDMLKPAYSFAGVSVSQLAMPYIDNWLRTRQSISDTVKQFSIVGVALDMAQALAPGANTDLINRAELINRFRDNRNILFLDKTQEEFFMFNVPLSGLDALQAQAQEQMAAVSHIPLIKLLGITPTGLNASSEGEIRVFYDFVRAYQRNFAQQLMNDICTLVQLSLFGQVMPGITWQWCPLHELNALELAEKQKSLMETHTGYAAAGIVRPDQISKILDNDPDSPYAGALDTDALTEPEDDDIGAITEYVEALTEQAANAAEAPNEPAAAPADTEAPLIAGAMDSKDEPHAAGAVYLADDKVLLMQRPDGTWGLPGGHIEKGETAERAARRELQEETGYRHRGNLQRVGIYDEMFHAFTGKTKQFPVTINDEHIGHGWFPVNSLPEPLHRTTGVIVDHARKLHEDMALDDHWVTAKPNGPDNKGTPLLIGNGGNIIGGAGGKLNQPAPTTKKTAMPKLKEGHQAVSKPFAVEKDPWGDYTAPGIEGSLPKQHVTIKGGQVVGMHPSLAKNTNTAVEGEAQAKSEKTLAKERETAERKQREDQEKKDAAASAVFQMTMGSRLAKVPEHKRAAVQQELAKALQSENATPAERVANATAILKKAIADG